MITVASSKRDNCSQFRAKSVASSHLKQQFYLESYIGNVVSRHVFGTPQKTRHKTCREDMKTCREDIEDMLPICRLEIRRHVFTETTCRDMSRHVVWSWSC